jgi:hypothetical protein
VQVGDEAAGQAERQLAAVATQHENLRQQLQEIARIDVGAAGRADSPFLVRQ